MLCILMKKSVSAKSKIKCKIKVSNKDVLNRAIAKGGREGVTTPLETGLSANLESYRHIVCFGGKFFNL